MPIIKNGDIVEDAWVTLSDDQTLPDGAAVIVSLTRWQSEKSALKASQWAIGVRIESSESIEDISGDISDLDLIALAFPAFTDGRAYSAARTLRDQHLYKGEIRAVGNVLRDQLSFMNRCGFDAFDVDETITLSVFKTAVAEIDDQYQPASDDKAPAYRLARG
ncbi:MAG: DUF934 domain-containing protein [Alphaproteobacteria bacterium]|nr:DUF934 domain-containing protein [Alphaproteobacteria bacterium]